MARFKAMKERILILLIGIGLFCLGEFVFSRVLPSVPAEQTAPQELITIKQ